MKKVNYDLYLVTDRKLAKGRVLLDIIKSAVEGGVTIVQLREKECSTKEFLQEAKGIKAFLSSQKVPFIINDRIDIALAVDADGVHIGQDDMPPDLARKLLGNEKIIGISVSNIEELNLSLQNNIDYLALSPIFSTQTKIDTSLPIGLEGIPAFRKLTKLPLIGIGGINVGNAKEIVRIGCDGIAVVSAIISSDNPEDASRKLLNKIIDGKKERKNEF